jgi:hypothetical protein
MQHVCSPVCALLYAKKQEAKKLRREKMQGRERLKTISDRLKEAQKPFNAWIRWRDRNDPCISCERNNVGVKWNAGHYCSIGANSALRFDEANVHKQCEHCNSFNSGAIALYRPRLIEKIGLAEVERLEGPHEPVKWTHERLIGIRDAYRRRLREARKSA